MADCGHTGKAIAKALGRTRRKRSG